MFGWIDIFKGGIQTAKDGQTHDGDRLIETAVGAFDPAQYEAPAVVGHPSENAPAFGWVEAVRKIRRDGVLVLQARFRDVYPAFAEAVRAGLYKKRSASFWPDGRLRHVGFLGAAPPAVAGLENIRFQRGGPFVEFAQTLNQMEEKVMDPKLMEMLKNLVTAIQEIIAAAAEQPQPQNPNPAAPVEPAPAPSFAAPFGPTDPKPEKKPDQPPQPPKKPESGEKLYTQAELEAAVRAAVEEARRQWEQEQKEKADREKTDQAKAEAVAEVDRLVAEGKIPPAAAQSGLKDFVADMAGRSIDFGGQSPAEWLLKFIGQAGGNADLWTDFSAKAPEVKTPALSAAAETGRRLAAKINAGRTGAAA
jgi:hypothetical protein